MKLEQAAKDSLGIHPANIMISAGLLGAGLGLLFGVKAVMDREQQQAPALMVTNSRNNIRR